MRFAQPANRKRFVRRLKPPPTGWELAALTGLCLLYLSLIVPVSPYSQPEKLDTAALTQAWLDPMQRQPGVEHERLAGTLLPVKIGLERYGHLTAWNPYLGSGQPTINNPFSYLFNPVYSLPVLLLGGVQGSKLATALALLFAGYNMWALARVVGVRSVGRVLTGALYMMSGGLAAKFFTGHFQLGLSLAWVPLVFAGLWWTLHSRNRFAPVLMALAFALLFTSGNIYYTLHTLICCAVIFAAHLFRREAGRWQIRWERVRRVALGGAFAVGLSALQFVPVLATSAFIIHDGDPGLLSRYSLAQAAINLTYPWEAWRIFEQPSYGQMVVVDYNSIGSTPFLLIGLALVGGFIIRRQTRRFRLIAPLALALAAFMMLWGAGQTPILQFLYANLPFLAQFRYVGRALAIAALWWILLAGIAADVLWTAARKVMRVPARFNAYDAARLRRTIVAGTLAWLYLLAFSAASYSGRLRLALGNFALLNQFNRWRFTTFQQAASTFWLLLLLALVVDTLLLALVQLVPKTTARRFGPRGLGARLLRLGVLVLVIAALADPMATNSQLLPLTPAPPDFSALYAAAREADPDTPFPMFREPYGPQAFTAYAYEIRNHGLSEGWRPAAVPGGPIPPEAGGLTDLPRWAVVSNVSGSAPRDQAQQFVTDNGYQQRLCVPLTSAARPDPCDLFDENRLGAVLYELPDALPYAFVAPADVLTTAPASLNAANVTPARVVTHRLDTIIIEADAPANAYLVVRETHFPGWQVTVDGQAVPSVTMATQQAVERYEGFIGVAARAGRHTYTLTFQPPGLTAGVLLFLVTLVGIGGYLRKVSSRQFPVTSLKKDGGKG